MKNRIFILLIFLIVLYTIGVVNASFLPLIGKVIYLDPGHGGKDPGAMYNDLKEADLNLKISLKIQEELEKKGAIVYLTRYGDYDLSVNNAQSRKRSDLSRRANIINESKADIYLSIHLNADTSTTWKGAQVFYVDANENNKKIAEILQKQFKNDLKSNREYKKIYAQYMYKRINIPGVLVECGFITNPNERYLLQQDNYQAKIGKSITDALVFYFTEK